MRVASTYDAIGAGKGPEAQSVESGYRAHVDSLADFAAAGASMSKLSAQGIGLCIGVGEVV